MAKRKITVTIDESLVEAAKLAPESLSSIVNEALAVEIDRRARAAALKQLLVDWDAEHGQISTEAAEAARRAFDDVDAVADHQAPGKAERSGAA